MRPRSKNAGFSLAVVASIAMLLPVAAAGQTAPAVAKTTSERPYTPPKTAWGDPDLQGVWPGTAMNGVPLERPKYFGTRAVLNDQEYARRVAGHDETEEVDSQEFVTPITKCDPSKGGLGNTPETCANGVRIGPPRYWDEQGQPNRQASLIVDPPDGRTPALTAEAQQAQAERAAARKARPCAGTAAGCHDSWTDDSLWDRCITRGLIGSILPGGYDRGNQIIQGPGYVVIRNEMIHEARVVPLDGRPHLPPEVRSWMGDSRGHWEGNTLVVETTNFSGHIPVANVPTSDDLRVVERFTRVSPDTLEYQATISDPKTWTAPWTIAFPMKQDPKYQLYEYACHEGNYYMYNALTGARAEEKKAAEAAKKAVQ
ncbi:MAG TPA: hypothetical protein VMH80_14350 [Bryobacteraceae bacterium]|nr:hypothetical protein [Bryobacteraceae bacterium]